VNALVDLYGALMPTQDSGQALDRFVRLLAAGATMQ
jgi:hypothetical protein